MSSIKTQITKVQVPVRNSNNSSNGNSNNNEPVRITTTTLTTTTKRGEFTKDINNTKTSNGK